jgi:hypothetical protein
MSLLARTLDGKRMITRIALRAAAFAAGLGIALPTSAQVTVYDNSATVGTSAAQCVPAGAKTTLVLKNQSASNTVTYCFAPCSPSGGASGSYDIATSSSAWWPPGAAPKNAINCVASGASTPLSVGVGQR